MSTVIQRAARLARVFVLPAFLLTAGTGCKKVTDSLKPKLPDATQEGKGTFGCVLDNSVWLTRTRSSLDSPVEATFSSGTTGSALRVRAEQEDKTGNESRSLTLFLNTSTPLQPGVYSLNQGFSAFYKVAPSGEQYVTTAASQGAITITKVEPQSTTGVGGATVRYTIVSGTFQFTASAASVGKTIDVKEGRFDVKAY